MGVLVMHFPPEEAGCEQKYSWCGEASEARLRAVLKGSTVMAIVSGHHHGWSGIWDWSPRGGAVKNAWGRKIKMIQAGSPVAIFGRRWVKIDATKCSMTFTIMEDRQPATTCGRNAKESPFKSYSAAWPSLDTSPWTTTDHCHVSHVEEVCEELVCLDVYHYSTDYGSENGWELENR